MKASELAKELLENPDFDIEFSFNFDDGSQWGLAVHRFKNVKIGDIGHSDKTIILNGEEK